MKYSTLFLVSHILFVYIAPLSGNITCDVDVSMC